MRRYNKGPGKGVSSPPRPKLPDSNNTETYNGNGEQSLAVGSQTAAEREFNAKVMRHLPGLPEPRVMVLLNTPKHPVENDAQRFADECGEAVAIVDMSARVLSYREPV